MIYEYSRTQDSGLRLHSNRDCDTKCYSLQTENNTDESLTTEFDEKV